MLPFVVRHAIKNVWCSPEQDRQALLRLTRASRAGGQLGYIDLQRTREYLPTRNEYYHVYVVGQNSPYRLNLPDKTSEWYSLAQLAAQRGISAELYTEIGKVFSSDQCFIRMTGNRTFLVAVKRQDRIADLDLEQAYLRLYSNSYFDSPRADFLGETIVTQSVVVDSPTTALTLQTEMYRRRQLGLGYVSAFHNGDYVDDFLPSFIQVGDIVEFRHDYSVKTVHEFSTRQLQSFLSALDAQQKYLLHPPKALDVIDFQDDVEVYVVKRTIGNRYRGRYFHRNNESSIRNVTHHDYSISIPQLQQYIQLHPDWADNDELFIRLHVKHSGYYRPLIDEHQRIKELYKLSDTDIERAMLGIDSTLEEWRAPALEAGYYTKIMRSKYTEITVNDVARAYGYNSLANIYAKVWHRVTNERVLLPVGLQTNSTIYEYDINGLLLGWRQHSNNETYYTQYPQTAFIEAIAGLGGSTSPIEIGQAPVTVFKDQSYRFYVCPIVGGQISNTWTDVTNTAKHIRSDGVEYWSIDVDGEMGAVVNDLQFTSYDLQLTSTDMVYQFSINHKTHNGILVKIPPGRVDIFLNGYSLIRDIDYVMDFPRVTILSSKYLVAGPQKLTIRCMGFCTETLEIPKPYDAGFIKYGMISVNSHYDVREDKSVSFIVGGRRYLADSLDFAEDGRNVSIPALTNGLPYAIEDYQIPVRGVIDYNTYPFIADSRDVDSRVSNYISGKLPEPVNPGISPIPERYPLYSPFLARVISDLRNNYLTATSPFAPMEHVSATLGATRLALLSIDPCLNPTLNASYLHIRPHPLPTVLSVTREEYAFLERLVVDYLQGKVDLTSFVTIQE